MLSRHYLEQVDRELAKAERRYRVAQLAVLAIAMLLFGCAALQKAVAECVPDRVADRLVTTALSSASPQEELTSQAKRVGFEVITCALWSVVRSLSANTQDSSVESFQPAAWQARRPDDQPKLDAAKSWLSTHNQTTEPTWKVR